MSKDTELLRKMAKRFREFQRISEGERGRAWQEKARPAFAEAMDCAADNLGLLDRCRAQYGCLREVNARLDDIREWAALPTADRWAALNGLSINFEVLRPIEGEHNPFVYQIEAWAKELERAAAAFEEERDEKAVEGVAEDLQPTSCLTSLQVVGSGQVYDGWEALREILASATRKVDIEDAHINADVVALLRSAPDGVAVRVLTKKLYEDADPAFRRLAKQKSGTLEVRTTADLHPRRVYVDDRAYILEDSIKDLALKTASSIVPVKTNEARRLLEDFERRWAGAGVRIRPKA